MLIAKVQNFLKNLKKKFDRSHAVYELITSFEVTKPDSPSGGKGKPTQPALAPSTTETISTGATRWGSSGCESKRGEKNYVFVGSFEKMGYF